MSDNGSSGGRSFLLEQLKAGPVHVRTQVMQKLFGSGKDVRKWAKEHGIKVTVHKGEVEFSRE